MSLSERIAQKLAIPGEVVSNNPVITITGEALVIESHQGIIAYTPEEARIRVPFGAVAVSGRGLLLKRVAKDEIVVAGCINAVELRR